MSEYANADRASDLLVVGGAISKLSLSKTQLAAKALSVLRRTGYGDALEDVEVLGPVNLPWCNWTIGTIPGDMNCAIVLNRIVKELQSIYDLSSDDVPLQRTALRTSDAWTSGHDRPLAIPER